MRVLIVGAGAVGGFVGARLAGTGAHEVHVVARGAHGDAIRERGLVLRTKDGEVVARCHVHPSVRDAAGLDADLAIIAVKATSLAEVAADTGKALASAGLALPLLNGVDSEEELARIIGAEHVVGGVARVGSEIREPGVIHLENGGALTLAAFRTGQEDALGELAEAFEAAGIPTDVKPDLKKVLWGKLLWNGPFNGICALTRRTPGAVLAVAELEALARDAMKEVIDVAAAVGVVLPLGAIDKNVELTRTVFAASHPSMLQDVLAGRTTEADALQGAVVRHGAAHGVPTPVHRALHALLLGLHPARCSS